MRTVLLGPVPPELAAHLERRRRLGLDMKDEIWEGELHMAPFAHSDHGYLQNEVAVVLHPLARALGLWPTQSFNLGSPTDYRVPDGGVHAARPGTLYVATALLVVEVLSPDDETYAKLDFYAAQGVQELLVVDQAAREVRCHDLTDTRHPVVEGSEVLAADVAQLTAAVAWP